MAYSEILFQEIITDEHENTFTEIARRTNSDVRTERPRG
jgi:hypothetical protein